MVLENSLEFIIHAIQEQVGEEDLVCVPGLGGVGGLFLN